MRSWWPLSGCTYPQRNSQGTSGMTAAKGSSVSHLDRYGTFVAELGEIVAPTSLGDGS